MKQSTFSAVMANSIKNLLQRYTKGIRFTAILTLLFTIGMGQIFAQATWIGNSYIVANGTWYNAHGTGQSAGSFHNKNLGAITSLTLGGEVQTYGQSDGVNNPARMHYQISGKTASYVTLYWYKYQNNNNYFHSNSNNSTSSNNAFASKTIDISNLAPGKYTLSVWFEQPNGNQWDSNNGNNYVASFTINPVVTFKANGGTGNDYTQTVTYDTNTALQANTFTRTGYNFAGWKTNANSGTSYSDKQTVKLKDNLTLYAQWTGKTYTVTLDNQGATTAGATSVTATYNAAMPSIANNLPKKTGHAFKGYFTATSGGTKYYNADGTSAKNWDKTDATTLYAQWTIKTYSVKWVVDGVELTGAQLDGVTTIVNHGDKITTAPKVVVEDYCGDIFVGWTDAEGGEYEHGTSNLYTTDFPQITNDTTLYAVFADYKK